MINEINYVFDVDGTLTPSRLSMDTEFADFFRYWIKDRSVYLLTGSDHIKTIEQVGEDIWKEVTESHQCGGNVIYRKGNLVAYSDWKPSQELLDTCQDFIDGSPYPVRAGNHLETRTGLLNVSVVGRDCSQEVRLAYNEWDELSGERNDLCELIMSKFPELEASAGGQISVDIHELGKNKSQLRDYLDGVIHFYGDKTMKGGNDYPIANVLKEPDQVFQVDDWQHTYKLLMEPIRWSYS